MHLTCQANGSLKSARFEITSRVGRRGTVLYIASSVIPLSSRARQSSRYCSEEEKKQNAKRFYEMRVREKTLKKNSSHE